MEAVSSCTVSWRPFPARSVTGIRLHRKRERMLMLSALDAIATLLDSLEHVGRLQQPAGHAEAASAAGRGGEPEPALDRYSGDRPDTPGVANFPIERGEELERDEDFEFESGGGASGAGDGEHQPPSTPSVEARERRPSTLSPGTEAVMSESESQQKWLYELHPNADPRLVEARERIQARAAEKKSGERTCACAPRRRRRSCQSFLCDGIAATLRRSRAEGTRVARRADSVQPGGCGGDGGLPRVADGQTARAAARDAAR
jgi:hypothetical protein